MAKSHPSDATDIAIAFYFQSLHSLIVLLDSSDGNSVSVETRDDVELHGPSPTLKQLKHSLATPPALTEKSDGFWNTISNWIRHLPMGNVKFEFVTCAAVASGCALAELTRPDGDRVKVVAALEAEAKRVVAARTAHASTGQKGSPKYPDRGPACEAFMKLTDDERKTLINRITIRDRTCNALDVNAEVAKRIPLCRKAVRPLVSERLIEWWDRRICRALLGQAPRLVEKDELDRRFNELLVEFSEDNLPDDFSLSEPTDLAAELGTVMERQIRLVYGGESRIKRAALARWRARSQRQRWLASNLAMATELDKFDELLRESWKDRFGPMCDDSASMLDNMRAQCGLKLLDWSHLDACNEVAPLRPKWNKAFRNCLAPLAGFGA